MLLETNKMPATLLTYLKPLQCVSEVLMQVQQYSQSMKKLVELSNVIQCSLKMEHLRDTIWHDQPHLELSHISEYVSKLY